MTKYPLLTLPSDILLGKFGSGGHSPGSGSAAAFIGLIAAQLIATVGQLTIDRDEYAAYHEKVKEICSELQMVLIPNLSEMFQADADAFDLVIIARRARDSATSEADKKKYSKAALDHLKVATAIPFRIAESCVELIDHSATVFDVGFKHARGDTGVALSAALAGVLSAVFVINLNLKSFKGSYWARQQRKECDRLQHLAVSKYEAAVARISKLRLEDLGVQALVEGEDPIASLWSGAKQKYSDQDIEQRAADLQKIVWQRRGKLWGDTNIPSNPVDLLDPDVAIQLLDYNFNLVETLGTFASNSATVEVAGLLEAQPGRVSVSRQMRNEIRRFTAAHELGHIVLHPQIKEAHRDRPLDGSVVARNRLEREADKFASYYLLPANLVRARFGTIFGTDKFSLNDDTAFALLGLGLAEVEKKVKNVRSLSIRIASVAKYNGRYFTSLSAQFRVSVTAMAIRLEELDLIRLDG